jgi:hypothetical protein
VKNYPCKRRGCLIFDKLIEKYSLFPKRQFFIPVSGTVCEPSKTAKSCSLKLEAISNGGKKSSALAIV